MSKTLTAEQLRSLLAYDRETGLFRWLESRGRVKKGSLAGCVSPTDWYIYIQVDGLRYAAHRLSWLYITGEWPDGEVDHRDTTRTNNRWNNLRAATGTQNQANRPVNKNNTTGFKGVVRFKRNLAKPFCARIKVGAKHVSLGYFATAEEAHMAYVAAARQHFGEFARAA